MSIKAEFIKELTRFSEETRDSHEYRRAIGLKMLFGEIESKYISDLLGVDKSTLTRWKQAFLAHGTEGLKSKHRGSSGMLSNTGRETIIEWIKTQKTMSVENLYEYVKVNYGIEYKSRQSYYDLLDEAGFSRKKAQRANPHRDEAAIEAKKKR